ncbi:hypothetical protein CCACVL1_16301 [Corchorus capsularis]|nr:hypothetical protein CCACVL1_16301 [Corchorus capsularis]
MRVKWRTEVGAKVLGETIGLEVGAEVEVESDLLKGTIIDSWRREK